MLGTSIWEYIAIRTCILFFQYLPPASIVILLLSYVVRVNVPWMLTVWFTCEAAFFVLVSLPLTIYIQKATVHPDPVSQEQRRALYQRCLDSVTDPERYLLKWFLDAPAEEIKRDNVKEFLRWAFFNKEDVHPQDEEELDEYVRMMEDLLHREIPRGRGRAKCLRLTLDEIHVLPRSLTWYMIVFLVDTFTSCRLLYNSFRFYRPSPLTFVSTFPLRPVALLSPHRAPTESTTYWHRPHTSKTKLPVLFIHGIGIGLFPYVTFLNELNDSNSSLTDTSIGILAIEILPISFRLTSPALRKEATVREIARILDFHGWDRFVLVSHSYGSVVSTHLLHTPTLAPRIAAVVLIDPVVFLLHLPDVAYNFTHRSPRLANELQLWYFASKDPLVAHTLARRFFWSENVLWKEDVLGGDDGGPTRPATVVLGGRDLIVDTPVVGAWLAQNNTVATKVPAPPYTNGHAGTAGRLAKPLLSAQSSQPAAAPAPVDDEDDQSWKTRPWAGQGLELLWFEKLDHAQVFDRRSERKRVVEVVKAYCTNHGSG